MKGLIYFCLEAGGNKYKYTSFFKLIWVSADLNMFNLINKELLAEEIGIEVVEKCGYPINLSGEKGILEFKNYYLSKVEGS